MNKKQQLLINSSYIYSESKFVYTTLFNKIANCNEQLTENDFNYLFIFPDSGTITISKLSDALGVSKPAATQAVNKFVKLDYVKKIQSTTDKRYFELQLSEKYLDIDIKVQNKLLGEFYDKLDEEKKEVFCCITSQLSSHIKKLKNDNCNWKE